MGAVRSFWTALLVVCLCWVTPAGAELIQHLDASASDSVVISGGQVVQWKDLSGHANDAVANRGAVLYPSTPFPGGGVGVDCGLARNDLQLLDVAGTSALLDFSGAAAGHSGFTVLFAFRLDLLDGVNDQYPIGAKHSLPGFSIRIASAGQMQARLANQLNSNGALYAAAGDTIVLGFSYEAATGATWLYESKNDLITTRAQPAHGDWGASQPLVLGEARTTASSSNFFRGAVGEVMIFNEYISPEDAEPYRAELLYKWVTPLAEKLKPAPLALVDVDEQPLEGLALRWKPGLNSTAQAVYFGTDASAVAQATPENPLGVYQGTQTGSSYPLPRLDYGTTYYYRIESISDAVYSSPVVSFKTIRYAYPLDRDYITASASSTVGALDPNVTCNRAGLDVNDTHNTNFNAMWLSDPGQKGPVWIRYDFDAPVKLNEILVWNHNSEVEGTLGWGTKDAQIEYTQDWVNWQTLANVTLAQAPGAAGYAANNSIPVHDLVVKGVRIDALSNYSNILPGWPGLSEVQFLVVPLQAARPVPANGQVAVSLDPASSKLSWTAGRGAVSHALYVSTDPQAVVRETVAPITVPGTSYPLAALDVNTVYWWKVNEKTGGETWAGHLWSFTTVAEVLLDGMEGYTADNIYVTWVDGFEAPQSNGSLVGKNPYAGDGDPFTLGDGDYSPENIVIHGGLQALPIWFDNTVAPVSKVTRSFTQVPDVGAGRMVLYYQFGAGSVGEQLFVEINGVEVASAAIPAKIAPVWSAIVLDLARAGLADATRITSMTIGIRGAKAKGVVYVDDILLTN